MTVGKQENVSASPAQSGSLTIENGAYGPLRQFLTEYLVARAFADRGDNVRFCGGRNSMFDIDTDPDYTDVKRLVEMSQSEQAAWPGCRWKLDKGTARNTQYPLEQISRRGVTRYKTHMALVRLDPAAGFGISMTSSGLQIAATFGWAQISWVPTPVVNDWIDGVDERYAYLEDAWLEEHHYAEIRPGQTVTELPVAAALAPAPDGRSRDRAPRHAAWPLSTAKPRKMSVPECMLFVSAPSRKEGGRTWGATR